MELASEAAQLTPKQAAERIGVHVQTLVSWRKVGVGPKFLRRAGRIFYRLTDLENWYENGDAD